MSVNVRIGNDTIENAKAIQLEDADNEGEYVVFTAGGITVRRARMQSAALPKMSGGAYVPTTPSDVSTLNVSASLLIPLDETIEDISYIAGPQGGLFKQSTGNSVVPAVYWNAVDSIITVTQTQEETGTRVTVAWTASDSSVYTNMLNQGFDYGAMRGTVFLIVTTSK